MADIYREDIATIDLAEPLRRDHVGKTYATGDKLGNRVGVRVRRNHADVDLTGHAATGYFIRPDLKTVVISGTVEGSAAWVEIPQACLTERGPFTLAIKISGGDVVQTVRVVDGSLILTGTDDLIDPGDAVPTLDDIFAQIAAMEAATKAATDAAAMASKATVGLVNAVNAQLRQIAPPIINTATGDGVITVQDSADRTLSGLRLYGKTTQADTPSPVAPVPMVNVGASGSITVTVEDGAAVTVQTPDGLPGIPVASGGSYTDASGQQWVCDEIDFGRGVHVQRVGVVTCDGSEDWKLRAVSGSAAYQFTLYGVGAAADGVAMATSLPGASSKDIISTSFAGDAIGVGTAAYYSGALIVRMAQSNFTGDDALAEFKAMLAASPMDAAYQLAEPVETPLPEETLSAYAELKTLYPATTVRNDAGAGMALDYVADTKNYVDKTGGGIGAETDPTVPAWAKQPEKPTYTAQEVGALPEDAEIVDQTARDGVATLSEKIGELKDTGVCGIEIDETLTKDGAAADAAATGKRLQSHDLILNGAKNLYFESPFERAGYYEVAKGTYNGDSTATSTELLPTDGFYKIKAKTSIAQAGYAIAFFDADKKLIPEISKIGQGGSAVTYDVEIPEVAKYVVVSQYGSPPSPRTAELVAIPGGIPARLSAVENKAFAHAYIGAAFGSFRKWGVVGDSLSVGHTQDSGGTDHARNIYYSWPQYMARAYGNTCLNFGQSGATAKSWMSLTNGYNRLVDAANLCQAYVVGLGANDAENLTNYTSGLGTAADINIEDSSGNADSFYGWYGKVVSTVRAAAPQAKIFLLTLPYPRNTNANVPEINTAIGEIAEMFDNTVLVDLSADYNDYFKDSRIGGALVAGHFTAAGYANIAKINAMALSDVMNANPADYKDIPFIPFGTATELD